MKEYVFASAAAQARAVRELRVSARALLEMYLERVEALDGRINAVVVRQFEQARKAADAADAALKKGADVGPLHGVPTTVKEAFDLEGAPTTWGAPAQKSNIAKTTAVSVERLQRAGAVVFGKTNNPLMLADWQSFNEVYGTTANPWNLDHTPGGSSGGSAAALAAGFCGFEWGSDIGGSLRVPAHFCGIYAHKPTWGIVPPEGHGLAPAPPTDVSVVGPMARSAEDLEIGLKVTAGAHGPAARGWKLALPACEKKSLKEFRVAVMDDAAPAEVDGELREALGRLVSFLRSKGTTVENACPDFDLEEVARDTTLLLRGATSGKLPMQEFENAWRLRNERPEADDSYQVRYARGIAAFHREWLQTHARRQKRLLSWEDFFSRFDVLICPPASTAAFRHDHSMPRDARTAMVNGRPRLQVEQVFWAGLAGTTWLPATAAPLARTAAGLPIGVQIVGPLHGDFTCLRFAQLVEHEYRGFDAPPDYAVT